MFTKTFFAAGALLSLVAAVPMQKRDIVWTTEVHDVVTTVDVTATVWVTPGEPAPTETASHFGHHGHKSKVTSHIQSTTTVPAAASSPTESAVESAATSATSISLAPAPSKVESTTEASTSTAAPAVYSTPSTTTSAAAAATSSSSNGSSGQTYTGDITHYTVGTGSCGWTNSDSEAVVALAEDMMEPEDGANPNNNPLCGKMITISYAGKQTQAKIVDTCPGCAGASLDLSPTLFTTVAPNGDGRVSGVEWWYTT